MSNSDGLSTPNGGPREDSATADGASQPTPQQIRKWRKYLANELAEAAVYRELARKRTGEEREILLSLAEAETRHQKYWRDKLGLEVGMPQSPSLYTRMLGWMAKNFGSVFVLALMQNAESGNPYEDDEDAPAQIAADENVHAEVVRGLAAKGRERISGDFRAAVFGANDGLVSNVALVIGVMGSGMPANVILLTGISGLLAGALSMATGEYISVRSQQELLEASRPALPAQTLLPQLDVNANELALVYQARGLNKEEASERAAQALHQWERAGDVLEAVNQNGEEEEEAGGSPMSAAVSSFLCFGTGAFVPLIPFIFGASPTVGGVVALVLVSMALLITGGLTGILSGKPPAKRALRQLLIGLASAGVTYVLGLLFGLVIG